MTTNNGGDILERLAIRPMIFIGLALVTGLLPSAAGATASPALRECQSNLSTCENNLGSCNSDLSAGRSAPKLPATGQTSSFVPGDDGVIQAGAPLSYTNNGDGTVTDNNTGLMWEKKTHDGTVHDKDNLHAYAGNRQCAVTRISCQSDSDCERNFCNVEAGGFCSLGLRTECSFDSDCPLNDCVPSSVEN